MKTSIPNTTGGTNPTSMLRSTVRAIEPYVPILPFEVLADRLERPIEEIIKPVSYTHLTLPTSDLV